MAVKKSIFWWLLCLLLTLLAGLRYGVGGDTFAYLEDFVRWYKDQMPYLEDAMLHQFKHVGYMPLWTACNIVLREWTDSFYIVQLLEAAFVNGAIFYVVRKHCDSPWWFVFFYLITGTFFLFNTEVMREGIAVACALMAIERYTDGHKVRYWLWVILAIGFHLSAFVLLIYPFINIRLTRRNYLIAYAIAFGIWAGSSAILTILSVLEATGILGGLASKIAQHTGAGFNFFGFIRFSLMYLGLPLLAIYFNQQRPMQEEETRYRQRYTSLVIVVSLVIASMGGFSRFNSYLIIFILMTMAELTGHLMSQARHIIMRAAVILMFTVLYVLNAFFIYWPEHDFYQYQFYFPYTTIIDEEHNDDMGTIEQERHDAHLESADCKSKALQ